MEGVKEKKKPGAMNVQVAATGLQSVIRDGHAPTGETIPRVDRNVNSGLDVGKEVGRMALNNEQKIMNIYGGYDPGFFRMSCIFERGKRRKGVLKRREINLTPLKTCG